MMKRAFDLVVAAVGLCVTVLFMIPIAVLISIPRDGPILFRQTRVGRHGVPFTLFKFRTMRVLQTPLEKQVTVGADARITRVGAFLRNTKLDELPQLWNVARGDMSLVGPRPETPEFVAQYPHQLREIILSVRPGITDLASIKYRNEAEQLALASDPIAHYEQVILPDKLAIAVDYVRSQDFWTDVRIIAQTLFVIIQPSAAPAAVAHLNKRVK